MLGSKKKSSARNTLVGQSVNNASVRKVGQPVDLITSNYNLIYD
jgi:hypothetical protein